MTKSQLQPGMIAVTREGNEYLVLPERLFGLTEYGINLDHYDEILNLSYSGSLNDIMQVYATAATSLLDIHETSKRTLVWQREEYEYPLYRKNKIYSAQGTMSYDYVVAFTAKNTGTVVLSDASSVFPVGYTATNWIPHTDDRWEIVEPPKIATPTTITLEDICKALGVTIKEVR